MLFRGRRMRSTTPMHCWSGSDIQMFSSPVLTSLSKCNCVTLHSHSSPPPSRVVTPPSTATSRRSRVGRAARTPARQATPCCGGPRGRPGRRAGQAAPPSWACYRSGMMGRSCWWTLTAGRAQGERRRRAQRASRRRSQCLVGWRGDG